MSCTRKTNTPFILGFSTSLSTQYCSVPTGINYFFKSIKFIVSLTVRSLYEGTMRETKLLTLLRSILTKQNVVHNSFLFWSEKNAVIFLSWVHQIMQDNSPQYLNVVHNFSLLMDSFTYYKTPTILMLQPPCILYVLTTSRICTFTSITRYTALKNRKGT